jgi:hypothetical protein
MRRIFHVTICCMLLLLTVQADPDHKVQSILEMLAKVPLIAAINIVTVKQRQDGYNASVGVSSIELSDWDRICHSQLRRKGWVLLRLR